MANLYPNVVIDLIKAVPPSQACLIRGPHGIGKSQVTAEVGKILDLPVIDLRLSQMTEGDFLGLPVIVEPTYNEDGSIKRMGRTEFRPPWWFVKAMEEPCVVLLDEINRAVPEVMQCAFQLVLDRAVQGRRVHPETRIVAAANISHHYQVNEMDPALLDRFLVVDMVPEIRNWKKWALGFGVDPVLVEFCVNQPNHWWFNPGAGQLEPNKVYPTPRSWQMLNDALTYANLLDQPSEALFRHISSGLIGNEAAAAFYDYVKNYDRNISADQVLNKYDSIADRVKSGLAIEQVMTIVEKLAVHSKSHAWKKAQALNIQRFMIDLQNGEQVFAMWNKLNALAKDSESGKTNALLVHRHCRELILGAIGHGGEQRAAEKG